MFYAIYAYAVYFWQLLKFLRACSAVKYDVELSQTLGKNWEAELEALKRTCTASIDGEEWAVVTGAATGLGREMAKVLLDCGYNVIVACRNEKRGKEAIEGIRQEMEEAGNPSSNNIIAFSCDLGDLRSVDKFVEEVKGCGKKVTVYVGNAAVLAPPYSLTPQGYIHQVGVNFYASAVLLGGFVKLMKDTKGGKAIVVSSGGALKGWISSPELTKQTETDMFRGDVNNNKYHLYNNSKLAMMVYTESLVEPLAEWNAANPTKKVTVSSVHPGILATPIGKFLPIAKIPGYKAQQEATSFSVGEGAYYTLLSGFSENPAGTYCHMMEKRKLHPVCEDKKLVEDIVRYVEECRL